MSWSPRFYFGISAFVGFVAFFLSPQNAFAANRYWVGTDGANTNDTANWASANPASCTGGGASVPSTSDVAIFDPDCDSSAAINATFTVQKIEMQSGYTGTVTQNSTIAITLDPGTSGDALAIAGGTFVGGDTVITITDGNFNQSGGAFTNSSAGMTVEQSFTVSGGTFTNTNKTVTFIDSTNADDTTVTCSSTLTGTFVITKDSDADFINSANCTISLGADPTTTIDNGATNDFLNNGTITIPSGTWTVRDAVSGGVMTNAGTITHSGTGWDFNDTGLTNNSGATITYAGTTITMERSFTQSGTFDLTGKTITFDDTTGADDTTITCTGSLGGTVVITKGLDGDFINSSGCSISLGADPTTTIDSGATNDFINNGTITIPSGTWTVNGTSGAVITNAGTITHSGDGWDINNVSLTNNSGASITYSGATITIEEDFTQSGTFDLTGKTITFDDSNSSDDTTISCTGSLGGTVVITKDSDGDFIVSSGCSIDLGASPTTTIDASATNDFLNNGTITIPSGTWTIAGISQTSSQSATLINAGTITHSGSGWDVNDANVTNNLGATITYAGTGISIEMGFSQSGTFDLTGKTITFDDSGGFDDTTVSCTGSLGGTVVITKDNDGDFIVSSGCSIDLGADPTTTIDQDATTEFTNNGTITVASGTWTVTDIDVNGATFVNKGTLTHSGSGWILNDTNVTNSLGATISYAGTSITMERSIDQSGTFDLSGKTITFNDSSGSDDTTITCTGSLGGTVVITKDAGGDFINSSGCSINLGANPATSIDGDAANDFLNNGTIVISSGTWIVDGVDSPVMTNVGTITHSGDGWDIDDASLTNDFDATITYAGTAITVERNFDQSGTFNLSGKTITFDDSNNADDSTLACTSFLGGTVVITKDSDGDFINSSDCIINLGPNPTTTIDGGAATDFDNNGTITIPSGTWTVVSSALSDRSVLNNDGTITHSGDGWDFDHAGLVNNSGATVTYGGTAITMAQSFTQNGTFDLSGKTITFDDASSIDATTITCTGSLGGTVVITKDSDGEFSNSSGCSINLGANPTTTIDSSATPDFDNNGTITIPSGTWTVNGVGTPTMTNSGTITHSGSGWDFNDASLTNNSGATITYSGTTITMEGSLTQSGTFDLSGKTITFDDTDAFDDTTITCTGTLGGTVVIAKDNAGNFINSSGCSINLGASPTTSVDHGANTDFDNFGTFVIPSGTWTVNATTGFNFRNYGTVTHNGSGWDMNNISLTNTGTITYAGTSITMERLFTQSGTFDLSGKTITFDDTDAFDDTTITCTGTLGGTIVNAKDDDGDFSVASGCSINLYVAPSPTPTAPSLVSPANGALSGTGLPTFTFKKSTVDGGSISSYTLHVGTQTFSNIPANSSSASNPASKTHSTEKYTAQYFGEGSSATSSQTIAVTLKYFGTAAIPLTDGSYTWYVQAVSDTDTTATSSERTLYVDVTKPKISNIRVANQTLTATLTDTRALDEATVTLAKANTLLGTITSYTSVETRTYTLSGTTYQLSFTPRNSLAEGESYRYTIEVTDQAGHTTTATESLRVLSEAQAAQEAAANLDPATTDTDTIIETLRNLLPKSPLNLVDLQAKAVVRRQLQAEQFQQFFDPILAWLFNGTGVLERTLVAVITSVGDFINQGIDTLASIFQSITKLATIIYTQTTSFIAQQFTSAKTFLASLDFTTPLKNIAQNFNIQYQSNVAALNTLTNWYNQAVSNFFQGTAVIADGTIHAISGLNPLDDAKSASIYMANLFSTGKEVRVRQGLANRQRIDGMLRSMIEPVRKIQQKVALVARFNYEIIFNKEPTKIMNVAITSLKPTSVVVTWDTNHLTRVGKVNYGIRSDQPYTGEAFAPDGLRNHHEVIITDLQPSTTYYFEVMNQNGGYVYDAYYTFTTVASGEATGIFIPQDAIILGDKPVAVYEEPQPTAKVVKTLLPGATLRALTQKDGWISLLLTSGKEVWVQLEHVRLVEHIGSSATTKDKPLLAP